MINTDKAYKCLTCENKEICKNAENMKKFTDELREKVRLLENQRFGLQIECQDYRFFDEKKTQHNFKNITT